MPAVILSLILILGDLFPFFRQLFFFRVLDTMQAGRVVLLAIYHELFPLRIYQFLSTARILRRLFNDIRDTDVLTST